MATFDEYIAWFLEDSRKRANRRAMERRKRKMGLKAYNRYHNHNYSVKKRILGDRTHGTCEICKKIFPKSQLSVDHIIPLMIGGTHDKSNLQLACKPCETKKDLEILKNLKNNQVI